MDLKNIIFDALTALIASSVTFFTTKRKYKAESANLEYQNLQTVLSVYRTELEAMKSRINDYVLKITELEKKVDILVHENIALKGELSGFEKKFGKQITIRKNPE